MADRAATTESLLERHGPGYKWWAAATVMFGTMAVMLSATIVTVAIPHIMDRFGMRASEVQWLVTGFVAAMTASMLLLDWLVQAFGQRGTFVCSFMVFIVASVLGACAVNSSMLIAARVLQGSSAGVLQALSTIVLFRVFPPHQRGLGMGIYGMGVLLGPAVGPAIGGFLVDAWSWRAVFFVTLPPSVAAVFMALRFLPTRSGPAVARRFDWLGLALLVSSIVSLLWAFANGQHLGWQSPLIVGLLVFSLVAAVTFVVWQFHNPHPLLDLQVYRSSDLICGSLLSFAHGVLLYGSTYLIPLFVQDVQQQTATAAGMVLIPAGLVMALMYPFGGYVSDHLPPRACAVFSVLCLAASAFMLARIDLHTTFWVIAWATALGRFGLAVLNPPILTEALRSLPPHRLAHGSGAIGLARQLGIAFGVNLLVLIMLHRSAVHSAALGDGSHVALTEAMRLHATARGYQDSFTAMGILMLLALIPAGWIGGTRRAEARASRLREELA